jgi:drug/metabolite transporter (DMT)-like permease
MQTQMAAHLKSQYRFPLFCLILGAVAIGFAPIFVRLSEVGPIATGFWRVAMAFPLLTLFSIHQGTTQPDTNQPISWRDYAWILFAGIAFGADLATWHYSIHYTTVANATLLANFSPVILALWGWLVLGKRPQAQLVLGLALAVFGVAILVHPNLQLNQSTWRGDTLAFITSFYYTVYLLAMNRARRVFSALRSMTIASFSSMLFLAFLMWMTGEVWLPVSLTGWLVLLGLAFFSHILGQGLITYAFPYLPTTFAATTLLVQPMIAAIAGWFFFAEKLSLLQIAGLLIALGGIFLAKKTI